MGERALGFVMAAVIGLCAMIPGAIALGAFHNLFADYRDGSTSTYLRIGGVMSALATIMFAAAVAAACYAARRRPGM